MIIVKCNSVFSVEDMRKPYYFIVEITLWIGSVLEKERSFLVNEITFVRIESDISWIQRMLAIEPWFIRYFFLVNYLYEKFTYCEFQTLLGCHLIHLYIFKVELQTFPRVDMLIQLYNESNNAINSNHWQFIIRVHWLHKFYPINWYLYCAV